MSANVRLAGRECKLPHRGHARFERSPFTRQRVPERRFLPAMGVADKRWGYLTWTGARQTSPLLCLNCQPTKARSEYFDDLKGDFAIRHASNRATIHPCIISDVVGTTSSPFVASINLAGDNAGLHPADRSANISDPRIKRQCRIGAKAVRSRAQTRQITPYVAEQ